MKTTFSKAAVVAKTKAWFVLKNRTSAECTLLYEDFNLQNLIQKLTLSPGCPIFSNFDWVNQIDNEFLWMGFGCKLNLTFNSLA